MHGLTNLKLTGLFMSCVGTSFYSTLLKGRKRARQKWREDEEEDVRRYWMVFRKRAGIGNSKRKQ